MGQSITVQCPNTMSNLSNFRCRPRSRVGKGWKYEISTICLISDQPSVLVIRDIKYQTCQHSGHDSVPENNEQFSHYLCPIRPRRHNFTRAVETGNAVMGTMGAIMPISVRYQQRLILSTSKYNCATVNQKLCWYLPEFGKVGPIMPILSWRVFRGLAKVSFWCRIK